MTCAVVAASGFNEVMTLVFAVAACRLGSWRRAPAVVIHDFVDDGMRFDYGDENALYATMDNSNGMIYVRLECQS
jgi:hypothetical protein